MSKLFFYVGTYTDGTSKGIYLFEMDLQTGELTDKGLVAEMENPSYILVSGEHLYAVSETATYQNKAGSALAHFSINTETHALQPLGMEATGGRAACHLDMNKAKNLLMVANYSEGNFTTYAVAQNGMLSQAVAHITHTGSGPNLSRQEMPHAHFVKFIENSMICTIDLGLDTVSFYEWKDTWEEYSAFCVEPGSGPRHLVFNQARQLIYVVNELSCDVTVMRDKGAFRDFETVQIISSLPDSFKGENTSAALRMSADLKYLYVSNRGFDGITIFAIQPDGSLVLNGFVSTQGRNPRDFLLTPEGDWLIASNQDGGGIVVFSVDKNTGMLNETGIHADVDRPVCIAMNC